jgi:hypothetical protein
VFGQDVAAEILHNGQSILRSAGGLKTLMASLLQCEGRAKPDPNPVAILIVVARKFAETGIPESIWSKLDDEPWPIGVKRPPKPVTFWVSPYPDPTPEQRKVFTQKWTLLRRKYELGLASASDRRAAKEEFLAWIRETVARTITIGGIAYPVIDRGSLLRRLKDQAIAAGYLSSSDRAIDGPELANKLATIFADDRDWVRERTLAIVEETAASATRNTPLTSDAIYLTLPKTEFNMAIAELRHLNGHLLATSEFNDRECIGRVGNLRK